MQTKLLRPEHAVFLCHGASVDHHNMAFRDEIKCCYVEKINYCDKNSPIKFASFVDHSVFKSARLKICQLGPFQPVSRLRNTPCWIDLDQFKVHGLLVLVFVLSTAREDRRKVEPDV